MGVTIIILAHLIAAIWLVNVRIFVRFNKECWAKHIFPFFWIDFIKWSFKFSSIWPYYSNSNIECHQIINAIDFSLVFGKHFAKTNQCSKMMWFSERTHSRICLIQLRVTCLFLKTEAIFFSATTAAITITTELCFSSSVCLFLIWKQMPVNKLWHGQKIDEHRRVFECVSAFCVNEWMHEINTAKLYFVAATMRGCEVKT